MKSDLVNQKQPLGEVKNHMVHPSSMSDSPMLRKSLGSDMEVGNNAKNHAPPTLNIYSKALDRAGAHKENPFYWAGHPKKEI